MSKAQADNSWRCWGEVTVHYEAGYVTAEIAACSDDTSIGAFVHAARLLEACQMVISEHEAKPFHESRDNADDALKACRSAIEMAVKRG